MAEASVAELPVRKLDTLGRGFAILLALGASAACNSHDATQSDATKSGAASSSASSPAIPFVDVQGIDAELAKHRGRAVLLNFWATWCGPCVHELPELLAVGREFKERGGDVVLVSYDSMVPNEGREAVRKLVTEFASSRKLDAPILIYDAPDYDAINARFQLEGGVPATLAFDRKGELVDRVDEEAPKERFDAMMRKALGI